MPKFITPTEITVGGAVDGYRDTDVSAQLGGDAGSVAGIFLLVINKSGGDLYWGARKKGSTDDFAYELTAGGQTTVGIGVDGDDVVQLYSADLTNIDFYLLGYVLDTEGEFFTNAVDVRAGSAGTWLEKDISGDTGANTATYVFGIVRNINANNYAYGVRGSGESHVRYGRCRGYNLAGWSCQCSGSEKIEVYVNNTVEDHYVTGYLFDNYTSVTEAEVSPTKDATYRLVDLSGDGVPSNAVGIDYHIHDGVGSDDLTFSSHIRAAADETDFYYKVATHQHGVVRVSSQSVDVKMEASGDNIYLRGYFTEPAAGTPPGQLVTTKYNDIEAS